MQTDASVDWLTATFRCPKEWERAVDMMLASWSVTAHRRPWRFMQYDGSTFADANGHLAWGRTRQRHGIIQAGGVYANEIPAKVLTKIGANFSVTRLDVAVTFYLPKPEQLVREFAAANADRDDCRVILPGTKEGGGTLYVGSRASDSFGRLYDRGAKINEEIDGDHKIEVARLWRAEMEFKRARASEAYRIHLHEWQAGNFRQWAIAVVVSWFASRYVNLPISASGYSVVSVATRGRDDIRTISWLHEQVRPAMLRLYDSGKTVEVEQALNLVPGSLAFEQFEFVGDGAQQFDFFDLWD